jgi:isopropylmalate/homocitrate/citramalate synthase
MKTPWKSDDYFVSPLNYADEVISNFELPREVKIHDVTLRDGEQQTGIAFTMDEKLAIAEKLAEAGVSRIEAGMPAVSKQDEAAIREIVKRNLGPEIFSFCRCREDDVRLAVDCGVTGAIIEIPSSEHMIKYAYQWSLSKAIDLSVKATRLAHELGLYVVFFTIDATRASLDWLVDLMRKVAKEGYMDSLALVDTQGVTSTPASRYYVRSLKQHFEQPLEAHFHNDFGLANANSLAAVEEGATVVHSTVLGMGPRAGQTSTEQIALALELLYGIETGIKLDRLYDLGNFMAEIAPHTIPSNQPVVGKWVYKLESGMPAQWWSQIRENYPTAFYGLLPSVMGQPDVEVVLGKGCGTYTIKHWLEKVGLEIPSEETILKLVFLVKDRVMEKKTLLTEEEFRQIAESVL